MPPPRRHWLRADDGTFYRNCPLIKIEQNEVRAWPAGTPGKWTMHEALTDEWWLVYRHGVIRKDALTPADVLAEPEPYRRAYPRNPGLWKLDEMERRCSTG